MTIHTRAGLLAAAALLGSAAAAAPVPFVGCRTDGQQGPQPAPRRGRTPDVPAAAAPALAYYSSGELGVLAPRGWHCFGGYGSSGSTLLVAPEPIDFDLFLKNRSLKGPAVELSYTFGGTSGRFEVAEIAARVFPAARSFVAGVEGEGIQEKPFARGPYPADKRTYRGPWQLLFTTPAGAQGLGTGSRLAPNALPIDGVRWLHPGSEMDMTSLTVRLPPAQRPLVAAIIAQATPPPKR